MKKKRFTQSGFINLRVLLGVVLGTVGVLLALVGLGVSTQAQNQREDASPTTAGGKIAPEVLVDTAGGKISSVVILLAEQADVSAAYGIQDHDARGWFVYNTLSQHAARTQAALQAFLTAEGVSYQSFWAANMIVATVDRSLVESLAVRPDVARIDSNRPARWIEDPEVANSEVTPESPQDPNVAEWGVSNVNAPAVWALGFTGQGMVIGNQDTGTRWSHNALKPKYRGWNGVTADHNFNWHDSVHSGGGTCGPNTVAPCDDHGHGTHTAGTTAGDDGGGNQVGVAPGAKWIACRNMNVGNGTPATYTECFQFMMAPTDLAGNNANPALRPHVLNNSWGCPASEGCVTRAELETIVNNTQAAGIFVVVSAGNSGSGCSSVSDAPAIYSAAFSVGSITISNNLSSFSSRGPSTFYNPNLLKPNLSAPGSNVRSSTNSSDSSYGNSSGTSMAGPHVAGVVALLWSARPQLVRDIAATKSILENTANPAVNVSPVQTCGGIPSTQIPNNSFGYGRIDALAAVNGAPTPTPTPPPATPTPTPATPTPPPPTPTPTPPTPTPTPPPPTPTPTSTPPVPTPTPTATATAFPSPFTFPDLVVTKTDSPDPVQVGNNLTYTITVSNVDPSLSMTATMTDILPAGVNFVSVTPSQGSCTGTSTIVCNLGGIAAGASATVSLVVTPTVAGTLANTASVPDFEDPTPDNNRDTELTTVIPAPTPPPTATPTPTDFPGPSPTPSATATASPTATVPPTPTPTPSPAAQAINLSTRVRVQTGDNAGIGGFIITGSVPKQVLLRGLGPSLVASGITDALANPTLDLRDSAGVRILANNDWRDTQETEIEATGIPPTDDLEAAIVQTLAPGSYTVILRGMGMTSGVGLVEIYDLNQGVDSKLANLSTRAFVDTGNNIVIAGFILGGSGNDRIVARGIGPSLADFGVPNALANPTLELRDSNGALLVANNDWQDDSAQAAELIAAGLAPTNDLESGIAATLSPGLYTALLAGLNNGTGVGLVEVYDRGAP